MKDTERRIIKVAKDVDVFLKNFLKQNQQKNKLFEAMKYGLFSGGKKFRSYLIISSGKLFNLDYKKLITIGAAVECINSPVFLFCISTIESLLTFNFSNFRSKNCPPAIPV